ncbi:PspC domain-containing protein [Leucobacter sp. M11]|uniref:PspC domain-containing protein n=1 Tax=Leucobacter sp. M11 TaxID=2993565 RepID=UPI002D7F4E59|nr:PspC domain-containing protein [Leucobacter sp. M11]MEB4616011.1 PspC domain-containing protein [Leucobacter sp. M11]
MATYTFFDTLRRSPISRGPSRVLGGVCGGIAAKFGWNPTAVRLLTIVACLLPVIGIGTYLLAWVLLPRFPDGSIVLERLFTPRP